MDVTVETYLKKDKKKFKSKNQALELWKQYKKSKIAIIGLVILITLILVAIFADVIVDYESMAIEQNIYNRLKPPSSEHWFGTDALGRDVFARVVHATRISLFIGVFTVTISVLLGGVIGSVAGFFGGRIDNVLMRIMDVFMAVPAILLAIAIVSAIGPGFFNLFIALSVANTPIFARIVRASILSLKDLEYVEAAKAVGTSNTRIILRHLIPNALGPLMVQATLSVASMIIAASSLSFIGLGIQAPKPEWGAMLAKGKEYIRTNPNLVVFPGLAIVMSALALNLIGDGLRDALDPKLKGTR